MKNAWRIPYKLICLAAAIWLLLSGGSARAEEVMCSDPGYRCFRAEPGATGQVDSWISRINANIPAGQDLVEYRHYDNANLTGNWLLCREGHRSYTNQVRNFSREVPMSTSDYVQHHCQAGTVMRWVRAGRVYRVPISAIPTPGQRDTILAEQLMTRLENGVAPTRELLVDALTQLESNETDTHGMRPDRQETATLVAAIRQSAERLPLSVAARSVTSALQPTVNSANAAIRPPTFVAYSGAGHNVYQWLFYATLTVAFGLFGLVLVAKRQSDQRSSYEDDDTPPNDATVALLRAQLDSLQKQIHTLTAERNTLLQVNKDLKTSQEQVTESRLSMEVEETFDDVLIQYEPKLRPIMEDVYDGKLSTREKMSAVVLYLHKYYGKHHQIVAELAQAKTSLSEAKAELARAPKPASETIRPFAPGGELQKYRDKVQDLEQLLVQAQEDRARLEHQYSALEMQIGQAELDREALQGAFMRLASDVIVRLGGGPLDESFLREEFKSDTQSVIDNLLELTMNAVDVSSDVEAMRVMVEETSVLREKIGMLNTLLGDEAAKLGQRMGAQYRLAENLSDVTERLATTELEFERTMYRLETAELFIKNLGDRQLLTLCSEFEKLKERSDDFFDERDRDLVAKLFKSFESVLELMMGFTSSDAPISREPTTVIQVPIEVGIPQS